MACSEFIWRFTPSRTEPALLEEIFVQRQSLLTTLLERVEESARSGNKHQILLVGPRGIGKTHLIALLHHRIAQNADLTAATRIAWFLEDETITSYAPLMKRTYEILSEEYPAEFPRGWLESQLDNGPSKVVKAIEVELIKKFQNKTLLLFLENLDLAFEGLGNDGQKQWRAFLQTHPFVTVVATSQRLIKDTQLREKPFFGFFTNIPLHPLSSADAVALLSRIARQGEQVSLVEFLATPEGRSRVRALHHLAGGNHRVYVVLSGFITRDSLDELTGPFEQMADELTPYYQERMRWLTPQQRQIVEYLCAQDDPRTPKDVARQLLITENTVGSQLKKLLELGYVLRSPRGRESLYELAEPLMRLASDVKEKRRKPMRLLVSFLRVWYRPDVLPDLLVKAGAPSLRALIEAAILEAKLNPDPRLKVLDEEIQKALRDDRPDELVQVLEERAHTRGSEQDWIDLARWLVVTRQDEATLHELKQIRERYPNNDTAWMSEGSMLAKLNRYQEAIVCCNRSIQINPSEWFAPFLKGTILIELNQNEPAIECFDSALQCDSRNASAWFQKGVALRNIEQYHAALKCLDEALKIDPRDTNSWFERGYILFFLENDPNALASFETSLELDPKNIRSSGSKGLVLLKLGRTEEAIAAFNATLNMDFEFQLIHVVKGEALRTLSQHVAAIESFDQALALDPADASAWFHKGVALYDLREDQAALECFEQAATQKSPPTALSFFRCATMFALRKWRAGFAVLQEHLAQHNADPGGSTRLPIERIFELKLGPAELSKQLAKLVAVHQDAGHLDELGTGLVKSLETIPNDPSGAPTMIAWRDAWFRATAGKPELEIPMRIFRVGIDYLMSEDPTVLLDLMAIERAILRQALGLEVEDA